MAGAFGNVNEMTEEVQAILAEHREAVVARFGRDVEQLEGHSFTQQTVAGRNLLIKAAVGGGEFVHVKIFVPLPHTNQPSQLKAVAGPLTEADALTPLENQEAPAEGGAAPSAEDRERREQATADEHARREQAALDAVERARLASRGGLSADADEPEEEVAEGVFDPFDGAF